MSQAANQPRGRSLSMRRMIAGGLALAGIVGGLVAVATPRAEASKEYTPASKLPCAKCHTNGPKGDAKDLTACGKASLEVLVKAGYKKGETDHAKIKTISEK